MLTYLWNAVVTVGPILGPLLIIAVVLGYGLRKIPPMHYGRVNAFGKRGRVVEEGLRFLMPFVEEVELHSKELERIPLEVTVTSKDQLEIVLKLSVEFVLDLNLITAYEERSKERANGLAERIKTVVGEIAGVEKADDFIRRREAIVHLINCLLRLKDLPHKNIPIGQRLNFYETFAQDIDGYLEEETAKPDERSSIEEDYGIDILIANLTQVDFGAATKAALEKNKQLQATMKGTKHLLGTATHAQTALKLEGESAVNFALVSAGLAKKQVVGVEGHGMSPIPFLNLGGEGNGSHEGPNRKWKGGNSK